MSNSPLICYTKLSPNCTKPRNHKIDTITPHCVVGQCSVETIGNVFAPTSRQASSNYGIGPDGRIGLYVDEANRSWCSSNAANDNRAITIEVASDTTHPYAITDKAMAALIDLCTDICKRNGIPKLMWKADKGLIGKPEQQNITVHRWFANKACPGDYIYQRLGYLADEVNKRLGVTSTPATPTSPSSGTTFKVGDEVTFTGTTHYTSAAATSGPACKPGKAKVTAVSAGAAHPYHLIAVSGGGSTVYGWVNAKDISGATTAAKAVAAGSTVTITAGAVYGGLSSARGAKVPSYVTGSRRYTVKQVAAHNGVQEALLSELNSWVALSYLTVV